MLRQKRGSVNQGRGYVSDQQSGSFWGYKTVPHSTMPAGNPVQMHPLPNYQIIPGGNFPGAPPPHMMEFQSHVRYAPHPGHGEPLPVSPVVFPYAMAPGQAHMFAPVPPPGVPEGGPRSHYQHFIPMPMHSGPPPRGGVMTPDMLAEGMDRLSLNPMAKEFVPPYGRPGRGNNGGGGYQKPGVQRYGAPPAHVGGVGGGKKVAKEDLPAAGNAANGNAGRVRTRKRRSRRSKDKQQALQENIRKTIYISDIDQQITEEQLATVFSDCGVVVDCRVCGDPNSAMRFAFIEFLNEEGAQKALKKNGTELGASRLRVLPSKTAIVPVNKELMPKNKEEMEQCSRTVYATNIDKKVDRDDVMRFFEALCGPVGKLRLLGDHAHSTRIAFVEFLQADSALAALSCSGALLGTMPIRVSPSKTPVRFTGAEIVKRE